MRQEKYSMETVVKGSDDGQNTYEVQRSWDVTGKKAIIVELYPTLSVNNADTMDLSTMHLLNHKKELGIGSIRILNLYSSVQSAKPSSSSLTEDIENLAYISEILEEDNIRDYVIILAWGSSLANHLPTVNSKIQILNLLQGNNLSDITYQLFADDLDTLSVSGVHPLYLGLHFNKSTWKLIQYPIEKELEALSSVLKPTKTDATKGAKKNVLQTKK